MAGYTPMIQQYLTIKAEHQDAFLFFRLGDFYEMFFDDAIRASQELEITLTSREGGGEERIPMCGVPYHSAAGYIEQLIERGYKVAICEQTEDPKEAKGVVKREVVQLITPGTVMEGKRLAEKENNFLASITSFQDGSFAVAFTDLTTGESFVTSSSSIQDVINEVASRGAKEIVIDDDFPETFQKALVDRCHSIISVENTTEIESAFETITSSLTEERLLTTFGRLLNYLARTQKRHLTHLQPVSVYLINQYMKIDAYSMRNLELTETIRSKGKKGSLLWLLDETKTAMGGRMLKNWISRPLINKEDIETRLNMVETLKVQFFERMELAEHFKKVYDLERLAGRVAFGNVNGRDLIQLKVSLLQIPLIQQVVASLKYDFAQTISNKLQPCDELTELLQRAIKENPPISVKEGGVIKDGYHEELDQYRDASRNGKTWIAELEKKERERTGIKSLKIGFNRVFGYYIEVTKANLHLLPNEGYERKQTLTNAERFITPELKEKERLILEAQEKIVQLEYELFIELREMVKGYIPQIQQLAKVISELDVLCSFAEVSEKRHYRKPSFSENELFIKNGRHPVVEKVMDANNYVPNDCHMGSRRELLLITGPNMSGKSTYMRQIALTAILAQIGCFVPADEAALPIFDQVFTRIGAADDLISGQSTFMVEMLEAKNAIDHATENSLILFDEIGRGTSTYDGMALAQAIIEYIHDNIKAKTLFSTHYHELTELEMQLQDLINIHVSAIEENGKVVFLHKIKEGAADQSYGIHVAQLAELPPKLINRARTILEKLEKAEQSKGKAAVQTEELPVSKDDAQLSFFLNETTSRKKNVNNGQKENQIIDIIKGIDLLAMTPLEAMNKLYEIQKSLKNHK